jgi:hypothetical protein
VTRRHGAAKRDLAAIGQAHDEALLELRLDDRHVVGRVHDDGEGAERGYGCGFFRHCFLGWPD